MYDMFQRFRDIPLQRRYIFIMLKMYKAKRTDKRTVQLEFEYQNRFFLSYLTMVKI